MSKKIQKLVKIQKNVITMVNLISNLPSMSWETIREIASNFFEKLCIEIEDINIKQEAENIYYIQLKTPDSWLLIWYAGKSLEDIRTVLKSIIVQNLENKSIILHLEVNDYLSKKENKLHDFIMKKIQFVKSGKWDVVLPFFNSYERKKIHSYVCELNDSEIFTKSVWEWSQRRLHICKKSKNITIDIDGIDI